MRRQHIDLLSYRAVLPFLQEQNLFGVWTQYGWNSEFKLNEEESSVQHARKYVFSVAKATVRPSLQEMERRPVFCGQERRRPTDHAPCPPTNLALRHEL